MRGQGTQKGLLKFSEPFPRVPLTPQLGHKVSLHGNRQPMRGLLSVTRSTLALATQRCYPRGLLGASLASGVH